MKVSELLALQEDNLVLLGLAPPKKGKKGKKQKFFGPFAGIGFVAPTQSEPLSDSGDGSEGGSEGSADGSGGGGE